MVCVLLFILLSWALQMLEVSLTLEQGQSWALGGWRLKKLTIDQVLSILHLCSFQSVSLILLWLSEHWPASEIPCYRSKPLERPILILANPMFANICERKFNSTCVPQLRPVARSCANWRKECHIELEKDIQQCVLLLLRRFSPIRLHATPQTAAHQAPRSPGFSRQEHWSGLPFPSPMHECEK